MKKKVGIVIGIIILFIILGIGCYYYWNDNKEKTMENENTKNMVEQNIEAEFVPTTEEERKLAYESDEFHDFYLYDAEEQKYKLSDFIGKPMVINFWASWCKYCKEEMPDIEEIYKENREDITFLIIDVLDKKETKEIGIQYIRENSFSFPFYSYKDEKKAMSYYGMNKYPSTLFVSKEGKVLKKKQGKMSLTELQEGINLLK